MAARSIRDLLGQYFELLDEQRAWKKRCPFPKRAELQAAEARLRSWRDVSALDAVKIPDLALCNICGLVNERRAECSRCGNWVGESSKAATATQINAWLEK